MKKNAHRLGASQVDNLRTTIAVLLLLSALSAVVSVRDAWPTADRAPPLILRRRKKKRKYQRGEGNTRGVLVLSQGSQPTYIRVYIGVVQRR